MGSWAARAAVSERGRAVVPCGDYGAGGCGASPAPRVAALRCGAGGRLSRCPTGGFPSHGYSRGVPLAASNEGTWGRTLRSEQPGWRSGSPFPVFSPPHPPPGPSLVTLFVLVRLCQTLKKHGAGGGDKPGRKRRSRRREESCGLCGSEGSVRPRVRPSG